jgi:flagellar biosynthesis protein FlhB
MAAESDPDLEPDPERAALIREVAEDLRADGSERAQLAAILYRVSDLYDPDEETTPEEIYRNVKYILGIKEQGGIGR